MQFLWNRFTAWVQSKGGFAHVAAIIWLTAVGAYSQVPAFHQLVVNVNNALPGWLEQLVLAIVGLIVWYKNTQADGSGSQSNNSGAKTLAILVFLTLAMYSLGCSGWERTSFQALATSKATIDQAQADYESGKLPHTTATYNAINAAKDAQTVAVNQLVAYEGAKAAGKTGNDLAIAEAQVTAAMADLPPLIAAIKALYH